MGVFKGEVATLPPDKSISHRAALIAALSAGVTEITNFSGGYDNQSTLEVLRDAGIPVRQEEVSDGSVCRTRRVVIESGGLWSFRKPDRPLMCNNSGSTMRMVAGMLAAQPFESVLVGDSSLMRRPMQRVADPLRMMGAMVELSSSGTAPVRISGRRSLSPFRYTLPVPSAQVKSLVTFAALHAEGTTRIVEPVRSRDHTELMLGLECIDRPDGGREIVITGGKTISAKPFLVPADPSAACFFVALALLGRGSELLLRDVCLNPTRIGFIPLLVGAGADITIENCRAIGGEPLGDILIRHTPNMDPLVISDESVVAGVIDELPMLSVLSAFMSGEFELHNARELRAKESDRIDAVVVNLERLGFNCEQYPDGFRVTGRRSQPPGTVRVETFGDHRIAMSFAVASEATGEPVDLSDREVVGISFPGFFDLINTLRV